jgi:hypothetical protein
MADSLPRILAALAGQSRHDPRERLVRLAAEVRARHACEYCLMPTGGQFQIDHIFPPMLWDCEGDYPPTWANGSSDPSHS